VSWYVAPKPDETPAAPAPPEPTVVRIKADLTLVQAAEDFVHTWLIRKTTMPRSNTSRREATGATTS
jgi:hypothetical protein